MKETADSDRDRMRSLEIEFIGGPYDGHMEPRFTWPAHLPADVVWLVCEDAFRLLHGNDHRPCGSLTSVALYELEVGSGRSRYRFLRAISVKELTDSMRETEPE